MVFTIFSKMFSCRLAVVRAVSSCSSPPVSSGCQSRMPRSSLSNKREPLKNFSSSKSRAVHQCPLNSEQGNTRQGNNLLVMTTSSKMRDQFFEFFPEILKCLTSSPIFHELTQMKKWTEQIVDYNVLGGKMNRGIALVESYSIFKNQDTAEDDIKIAIALGWAVEMLQAFFLVADDIMDNSLTRRTKPCWYRTNNLGVKGFNDAILLESLAYQIIRLHCKEQHYYLPVLELFHDVTLKTSLGQAMDLHSAPNSNEKPDLDKYTLETYNAIVKYKTAYYSFFLPVALAMRMAGIEDDSLFKQAEGILLPMGRFFQVQDDYLDCFGDPEVTGKIGTDIEDGKCTWLVVTALSLCDSEQRQLIEEHYGSKDPESVTLIKSLYIQLKLPELYTEYEENSYKELSDMIKNTESQLPASVFQGFMEKIYKRLN